MVEYVGDDLIGCGYDMVVVDVCNELMGYVGVVVLYLDYYIEVVIDLCSDGKVFV